ncbi:hypothetical protein [Sporosarcina luteola]|uniref:hypothetical protein n=1 Tax=Sporosarcina luteola TaxID=582850 RepID=UPI00203EB1A3|nr:hypothetical protein [Sporosarcina luteola]MCM3711028.1 hypothetical protein [Sporosarcina luteola]
MYKKSMWSLLLLLAMTFLMAACSAENEEGTKAKSVDNAEKYADVFEVTDEIAHDFMVVKTEQNYPEILGYLSSDGVEELKEKKSYLLDSHEYPNRFEELEGNYELRRYDNFYSEEKKEVYYRYRTPDDKNVLTNGWIIIKPNDESEWKVESFYGERPEIINDSNAETGTVLHELPKE